MTRLIGLDPSTKTGWVVGELQPDNTVKKLGYGELIAPPKYKGLDRLFKIQDLLRDKADRYRTELAIIEGYGYANTHTLATLVEIGTAIRMSLHNDHTIIDVPATTLKKFVTGSGGAKKDKMMLEVYRHWGFNGKTDNESDAYALMMFGFAMIGADIGIPAGNIDTVHTWVAGSVTTIKKKIAAIEKLRLK